VASTPLRILQTCFSLSWGGLELQALEVTRQLASRGHRVWLACTPKSRLHREATSLKLETLPLSVSGYFHPAVVWKLRTFIVEQKPDIIHCQLSKDIATLVPAMKLSLKPTPILLSKRLGSFVGKTDLFHRFTYANISRVLAISSVIRKNVIDTTPISPDRVVTLYDAVDTEVFSPERVNRKKVRDQFAYSDSTIVVGFVGRFSPGKGHEELLAAADRIRTKRQNVRFLVVGEASYGEKQYEGRIRSTAHSMGLDDIMTFAGFRRDIPELMGAFDLLAFPSHAEAFGVVLIEAMAMERAVVSTNCDGVLDIVVDGKTGIFVNPRNAVELETALLRLIDDEQLRTAMGKAGRKRVLELFDQNRQIERLEHLYHEVLRESTLTATPASSSGMPATTSQSSTPPAQ
jgi:glycosyltransferase involved in cell wall biosynthesis